MSEKMAKQKRDDIKRAEKEVGEPVATFTFDFFADGKIRVDGPTHNFLLFCQTISRGMQAVTEKHIKFMAMQEEDARKNQPKTVPGSVIGLS